MSSTPENPTAPDFEIDHPEEFGRYFLDNRREVGFYLDLLQKRSSLVTAYVDDGHQFFLTAIVAVDPENRQISIDPPPAEALKVAALSARKLTLVANLDHVKMQWRLSGLQEATGLERPPTRRAFTSTIGRTFSRVFSKNSTGSVLAFSWMRSRAP